VPIRLAWFSGAALTAGLEEHEIDGATIRVYGVAKTVADCCTNPPVGVRWVGSAAAIVASWAVLPR